MSDIAAEFEEHGFYLAREITGADEIDRLKTALTDSEIARAERFGQTYGARNLLHLADVRAVAANSKITAYLQPLRPGLPGCTWHLF